MKWAETEDGFIAPIAKDEKKPVWITNKYSRQLVHKWRTEEQAILVGTNTVLDDNPSLNARDYSGNNPIRIVLDKSGKINSKFHVKDNAIKTIILTENEDFQTVENCIYEKCTFDKNLIETIFAVLVKHKIQSVIIEGGSKTIQSFINKELWDEARIFKGKIIFKKGVKAPTINHSIKRQTHILTDELIYIVND